jgi:riboflavin synthase
VFTGIVETTGNVIDFRPVAVGRKLTIDAGPISAQVEPGASIAVNGVCLTVVEVIGTEITFDVIAETLKRSNLGRLRPGQRVNLERSLRADARIDGHFVQGHVDGTATVTRRQVSPAEWILWLRPDEAVRPYIIPKGSIAIDGISLTIADVNSDEFSVAIIPTTLERTTLASRQVGDVVNVESDILARTVVHCLQRMSDARGLTMDTLKEHGYL